MNSLFLTEKQVNKEAIYRIYSTTKFQQNATEDLRYYSDLFFKIHKIISYLCNKVSQMQ